MNRVRKTNFNVNYICSTAYRALFLLKNLTLRPLTRQEIVSLFEQDGFINQTLSQETVRVMINSLKEMGCKISRPCCGNNYKYSLLKNPFSLNYTKEEISLINKFRENSFKKNNWQDILNTNSLINNICLIIDDELTKEQLKSRGLLLNVNKKLVEEIHNCCKNNSTVVFQYMSGSKLSDFEMITSFMKYERNKLYVWGYSSKYKDFSYLRIDKIKSLKIIDKSSVKIFDNYNIRYEIFDLNYNLEEGETLIQKTENSMIIDYKISNKFYAIQKFLEMGCDCKIISPEFFKKEFISTLKSIKEVYENE